MAVVRRSRKMYKRKRRVARMTKSLSTPKVAKDMIVTKRRFWLGNFAAFSNGVWSATSYGFKLNDVQNHAEFTGLFQRYRIAGVKLTFIPAFTGVDQAQTLANNASGASYYTVPRMYYMVDRDGINSKTTENDFLEQPEVRIVKDPYKSFSVYCKRPLIRTPTDSTGGIAWNRHTSGYLDTSNATTVHYGITVGGVSTFGTTGTNLSYNIIATYYIVCKGVR